MSLALAACATVLRVCCDSLQRLVCARHTVALVPAPPLPLCPSLLLCCAPLWLPVSSPLGSPIAVRRGDVTACTIRSQRRDRMAHALPATAPPALLLPWRIADIIAAIDQGSSWRTAHEKEGRNGRTGTDKTRAQRPRRAHAGDAGWGPTARAFRRMQACAHPTPHVH